MEDPRIRKFAKFLINSAVELKKGEKILIELHGSETGLMKALVEEHGGRNLAAVSANVDFIVAGENMGPAKRQKAEKLGITILSEQEFMAMIEGAERNTVEPIATEQSAVTKPKEREVAPQHAESVVQGSLF